ncbi:Uncharacterised protein [Mycobacteroides abscessus subsp. abscessus]|nr:Uncharacterised protein [Mycobacteroides abscessus subsp. abscessus]
MLQQRVCGDRFGDAFPVRVMHSRYQAKTFQSAQLRIHRLMPTRRAAHLSTRQIRVRAPATPGKVVVAVPAGIGQQPTNLWCRQRVVRHRQDFKHPAPHRHRACSHTHANYPLALTITGGSHRVGQGAG